MKSQKIPFEVWFIYTLMIITAGFFSLLGSQLVQADEGGKIVFSKLIDDKWQIVVTDENGQNMQVLSKNGANDIDPTWSPDGRHIAFVSDRNRIFLNGTSDIYIMDADGSNQHQVTGKGGEVWERYPSFLPDGKKIVFTRQTFLNAPLQLRSEIYTIDIDGRNEKYLTDGSKAKWSPDGKKIVFLPLEDGVINCYVTIMDINSKNRMKITKGYDPSWSPDGKYIAFSSEDISRHWEVYKMDSDGKNIIRLTNEDSSWLPMGPSWSPDGKHIVFWDRVSNGKYTMCKVYKVSADGGISVPISEGGSMGPSWFDPAFAKYAVNSAGKLANTWGGLKKKGL